MASAELALPGAIREFSKVGPFVAYRIDSDGVRPRKFSGPKHFSETMEPYYFLDRFKRNVVRKSWRPVLSPSVRRLPPVAVISQGERQAVIVKVLVAEVV